MKRFALFGDPVAHSLSPVFQNAAMKAAGVDADYVAVRVAARELEDAIERVRSGELAGANVTIPHKERAHALVEVRTPLAERVKAVNWLGLDDARRLVGDNTDVEGFTRALGDAGFAAAVPVAVVLGAGGAARAAAYALARAGSKRVVVGARRVEKARLLAADLGRPEIEASGLTNAREIAASADLVVSTVPAAAWKDVAPAAMTGSLFDAAYDPQGGGARTRGHGTPAEIWARERGIRCAGGLGMLLHQGALSFERWLSTPFPMAAARAALGA